MRRFLIALLASMLMLSVATSASPVEAGNTRPAAPASNGNLSSVDNCIVAKYVLTQRGQLPGTWALYDSGYQVTNWTITPGLVFYECQFFSFAWGSAQAGVGDSDYYFGGTGFWTVGDLHFTFGDRQRFPGYTMQYCAQQYVSKPPGGQCF